MLFISTACPASRLMYDGYNTGMYEYDVMYVCIMRHNLVHKYFYQIMMHYTYMHHWLAGMWILAGRQCESLAGSSCSNV